MRIAAFASVLLGAMAFRPPAVQADLPPVAFRIQLDTLRSGFDKKTCWVHARAGAVPGSPPSVV